MSKRNISFVSFLMLLSLICVGFASWNINISDSAIGTIEVDSLLDAITTTYESFEYYNNSFLDITKDENGNTTVTQSDTGYIKITANLNTAEINKYNNLAISLTLEQKQKDTETSIVDKTYIKNIYLGENKETTLDTNDIVYNTNNRSVSTKIKLDTPNVTQSVYVFYIEFSVANVEDKAAFFNALLKKGASFSYLVTIEGE